MYFADERFTTWRSEQAELTRREQAADRDAEPFDPTDPPPRAPWQTPEEYDAWLEILLEGRANL